MSRIIHIGEMPLQHSATQLSGSPNEIAQTIELQHTDADIILINANYALEGCRRTDNLGILLLKFIRLRRIKTHCVLYSFLSREQLMAQDPRNAIIFSPGVTFIRMPYQLSSINFSAHGKQTAPENLTPYFKGEFTLPDNRHFIANWWGVLQLWKVHSVVANQGKADFVKELPESVLQEINSYNGLLARYIRGRDGKELEAEYRLLAQKCNEQRRLHLKAMELQEEQNELEYSKALALEDRNWVIASAESEGILKRILRGVGLLKAKESKVIVEKSVANENTETQIAEIDQSIKDIENRIREKAGEIIRLTHSREYLFATPDFDLGVVLEKFRKQKPKIVLVDDQAIGGWKQIFEQIFYGERNASELVTIQPESDFEVNTLANEIVKQCSSAHLLILDLRLRGEVGSVSSNIPVSGVEVLRKLKAKNISCPVLISSASNKIWSYRETLSLGASAFWIKEGLDTDSEVSDTVENYLRLIDLVNTLTFSPEFKFLREVRAKFEEIKKQKSFWWENGNWIKNELQYSKEYFPAKETILDILSDAIEILADYLTLSLQNLKTTSLDNQYSSLIIIRLASVLEKIHETDDIADSITLKQALIDQLPKDLFNQIIYFISLRNRAVHVQEVNFKEMAQFFNFIIEYITNSPTSGSGLNKLRKLNPKNGEWYELYYTGSSYGSFNNCLEYYFNNNNLRHPNNFRGIRVVEKNANYDLKEFLSNLSDDDKNLMKYRGKIVYTKNQYTLSHIVEIEKGKNNHAMTAYQKA